jgi:hypothetical protein
VKHTPDGLIELAAPVCERLRTRLERSAFAARNAEHDTFAAELLETDRLLLNHPSWPETLPLVRARLRGHVIKARAAGWREIKNRLEASLDQVSALVELQQSAPINPGTGP